MDKKIEAKLQALQTAYFDELPHKIAYIETKWRTICLEFNKENMINLHRAVHSLRGSSMTYGYSVLGDAFRDLEVYLKQLIDYRTINATHRSDISHLIEKIKDAFHIKEPVIYQPIAPQSKAISSKFIVYFIHRENTFKRDLQKCLIEQGFQLLLLKTTADFEKKIDKHFPSIILMDEHFLQDKRLEHITQFKQKYELPFLCIAQHDDVHTRLKAIRAGVSNFFNQSVDILDLTMHLVKQYNLTSRTDYRVLIVEDSLSLANYYALILQEAGMNTLTLTDPMQLMQTLQEFSPHLLLMDLYLPECTGFELALMVRQEERYMSLPLIFISTEDDRYKQLAILNGCGGDDFLTKPVLPQNLVAAVKSRAQRAALLTSSITRDSLTKLLNHAYILKQLDIEIARACRKNEEISVAMLDLDHFKLINDTYGHLMGDLVLKQVADILSKRIRQTDFIGRYGGEEIVIIFPDTPMEKVVAMCNKIRMALSKHLFRNRDAEFYVTISIGIANYPDFQTANHLIAAADRALYDAKSGGRNRVAFVRE